MARLVPKSRVLEDNQGTLIVHTYGHIGTISYLPTGFTTETKPTAQLTIRGDECILAKINDLVRKSELNSGATDAEFREAIRELGASLDGGYANLVPVSILSAFERMSKTSVVTVR